MDAETAQPTAFTLASAARTATQATPELLGLVQQVLCLDTDTAEPPLVLADEEHYTAELFQVVHPMPFDLLAPMKTTRRQLAS